MKYYVTENFNLLLVAKQYEDYIIYFVYILTNIENIAP